MDPGAILETLTKAGFVPVWVGNSLVTLMEASTEQWQEIRGSDQIQDLELELGAVENLTSAPAAATKKGKAAMKSMPAYVPEPRRPAASPSSGSGMELIPYVATVPRARLDLADFPVRPKPPQASRSRMPAFSMTGFRGALPDAWGYHGQLLWAWFKLLATYAPVFLSYCAFFYAFAALIFIAGNPRLWVKGGFAAVELAPTYFSFAASELWDETKSQVSSRFR